ncbi:beta-1,3-galactosyltransferase 9 [Carcharodon carcharias]|uniref:beta-1,3-galactosyltransferase 9 n=1 Tax=Carcharodon carcharias TaxID=13397 RepID=UPI001B7E5C49|nr:beta-1,3-galactosyltransferase 9 [Carcharodon carcharias]
MLSLSWRWITQLLVQLCRCFLSVHCPHVLPHRLVKYRVSRLLTTLLLVAVSALLVTVFSVGYIEEWLLRPVPSSIRDRRVSRMREKAALFDAAALKPEAPKFYRVSNPSFCAGSDLFLVNFVISKPAHLVNREAIRRSWGSVREVRGLAVRTLFALGTPESSKEQELIDWESRSYQDVVQGRFVDTYLNLTFKTIMVMRWFTTYCHTARYLLKVDDDVFLNHDNLVELLLGLGDGLTDLYLGRVHRNVRAIRNVSSLYYVSEEVYPADTYPNYCSGTSYVLSGDMAHKVYVAALSVPLLSIEDVFVGICAKRMGVLPTHTSKMSGGLRFHFSQCCYKSIITSHHMTAGELLPMWRLVNDGRECSLLSKYTALFVCKLLNLLDQVRAA